MIWFIKNASMGQKWDLLCVPFKQQIYFTLSPWYNGIAWEAIGIGILLVWSALLEVN